MEGSYVGGSSQSAFGCYLPRKLALTGPTNFGSSANMEVVAQSRLTSMLQRLAMRPIGGLGRSWVGAKPTGDSVISMIASNVGLDARGREQDFHPLSTSDAPIWLMLFATHSLLHVDRQIPAGIQDEIAGSLRALGSDAKFFSKGSWQQTRRFKHYEPVSFESGWEQRRHHLLFQGNSAPLPPIDVLEDGGLIGFDDATAFVFWVEEDD